MEKLIVLDYSTSKVHVYNVERNEPIDESYVQNLGYDSSNCNWMAGEIEVIQHKGILK
jgi:hypothetical protein